MPDHPEAGRGPGGSERFHAREPAEECNVRKHHQGLAGKHRTHHEERVDPLVQRAQRARERGQAGLPAEPAQIHEHLHRTLLRPQGTDQTLDPEGEPERVLRGQGSGTAAGERDGLVDPADHERTQLGEQGERQLQLVRHRTRDQVLGKAQSQPGLSHFAAGEQGPDQDLGNHEGQEEDSIRRHLRQAQAGAEREVKGGAGGEQRAHLHHRAHRGNAQELDQGDHPPHPQTLPEDLAHVVDLTRALAQAQEPQGDHEEVCGLTRKQVQDGHQGAHRKHVRGQLVRVRERG